jgi:quercetin dioxygenase-like cupin family protein
MAFKHKEINNPKIGQRIRFLQEMESIYSSVSKEPPGHYHPRQTEIFEVMEGELTTRINGIVKTLKRGEVFQIAPNVVHAMWNNYKGKTVVNWKVKPALNTEYLLETTAALAENNKTNEAGIPSFLQLAVMLNAYSDVFRLARPAYAVQKVIFTLVAPVGYWLGYRPTYQKEQE